MSKRRAFTLIELLVVVAIIALLISILLPSLARAREQAKLVKCGTNLHGIFNACMTYASQNQDIMIDGNIHQRMDFGGGSLNLGFAEALYIDGDIQQKVVATPASSIPGLGAVHYPVIRWSANYDTGAVTGNNMFTCPASAQGSQWHVLDAGADAGYGLSPWATSKLPDFNDSYNALIVKSTSLLPGKIFAADGGYSMAQYRYTSQPSTYQFEYWVYPRHFAIDTKNADYTRRFQGMANYAFCDGHVESADQDHYYRDVPSIYPSGKWDQSVWYQNPSGL